MGKSESRATEMASQANSEFMSILNAEPRKSVTQT